MKRAPLAWITGWSLFWISALTVVVVGHWINSVGKGEDSRLGAKICCAGSAGLTPSTFHGAELCKLPPGPAFQIASNVNDLAYVLGNNERDGASMLLEADKRNRLDLYLFIPAYTAYLILLFHLLATHWPRLRRFAYVAILFCASGDIVETVSQLLVTSHYPASAAFWIGGVSIGFRAKMIGIAAVNLAISGLALGWRSGMNSIFLHALLLIAAGLPFISALANLGLIVELQHHVMLTNILFASSWFMGIPLAAVHQFFIRASVSQGGE